ncbi:MAG: hypothetical protein AAGD22_06630 [Verrucomicrobiota bacterium]
MRLNPFDNDVVGDLRSSPGEYGRVALYAAPYEGVLARLRALVEGGDDELAGSGGEIILLTSARAGYGKTHFLARLREAVATELLVLPLAFRREQSLDWEKMLVDLLIAADRSVGRELSMLQEAVRRLFAEGIADMIVSGEVPCGQREEALRSLRESWRELLDPASEDEAVAQWFSEVFDALSPTLVSGFCERFRVSHEEGLFWVGRLYRYHQDSVLDGEMRSASLAELLRAELGDWRRPSPDASMRSKYEILARVLGMGRPVVYVADHLDSFYEDQQGGFDVASILLELASMEGSGAVILSVNADLWASVFNGHLPSAFEDRLSGTSVILAGIDVIEASAMIAERLGRAGIPDDMAACFTGVLGLRAYYEQAEGDALPPRQVLRHARSCWDRFAASGFSMTGLGAAGEAELVDLSAFPEGPGGGDPLDLPPLDFLQFEAGGEADPLLIERADLDALGESGGDDFLQVPDEFDPSGEEADLLLHPHERGDQAGDEEEEASRKRHGFQQLLSRIRGQRMISHGDVKGRGGNLPALRFNRLRREAITGGSVNGALDLGRLQLVLRWVGGRLPVLEQEEMILNGAESSMLIWRFDGDAVLFGFEASTNHPYWQSVVERGLSLRREESEEVSEGDDFFPPLVPSVKLVAFYPGHEPSEVASWKALHEAFAEGANLIDYVELDRETVGGLWAAAQLIEEVGEESNSLLVNDVFLLLVREFDYLWARLTRPLRASELSDGSRR